jgi:hypothetical protein
MGPSDQTPIPQSPFTKAGVAGVIGLAVMWCVTHPLYLQGYLSKDWGTLIVVIGGAIPYAYFKWRED